MLASDRLGSAVEEGGKSIDPDLLTDPTDWINIAFVYWMLACPLRQTEIAVSGGKTSRGSSVQFSSVPRPVGSLLKHEGRSSKDPLPVFSAGGHREQFWHGQGALYVLSW